MDDMPKIALTENVRIPVLGLGTWQLCGEDCYKAVSTGLELGYRHIDTANIYRNQSEVGSAIKNSGIGRSELFVTSKVWWSKLSKEGVIESIKITLEQLGTDYVDLYLIHWPNREVDIRETLVALDKIRDLGLIRAIGVSNFGQHHLEEALRSGVSIVNNQVEYHPSFNQESLRKYCENNGIVMTAYSPLAQGEDLQIQKVVEIARKHQVSASQVILKWIIQKGMVAIPRSVKKEHLQDNLLSFKVKLSEEEVAQMDGLNTDNRTLNPDFAEFDY